MIFSGDIVIVPKLPVGGTSFACVAYPMEVSFTTPFFALSSSNKKLPSFCVTVPAINAESVQVRSTTLTNSIGSLFSSTTLPVMFCAKEV